MKDKNHRMKTKNQSFSTQLINEYTSFLITRNDGRSYSLIYEIDSNDFYIEDEFSSFSRSDSDKKEKLRRSRRGAGCSNLITLLNTRSQIHLEGSNLIEICLGCLENYIDTFPDFPFPEITNIRKSLLKQFNRNNNLDILLEK
jgi:hypothetical protein